MTDKEILSQEFLSYLSRIPKTLKEHGPSQCGYFALDLGKCLTWVSGHLEPQVRQSYQPLEEKPETLFALGEQFRQVGLHLIDRSAENRAAALDHIRHNLEGIERRLAAVEAYHAGRIRMLHEAVNRKGGRK